MIFHFFQNKQHDSNSNAAERGTTPMATNPTSNAFPFPPEWTTDAMGTHCAPLTKTSRPQRDLQKLADRVAFWSPLLEAYATHVVATRHSARFSVADAARFLTPPNGVVPTNVLRAVVAHLLAAGDVLDVHTVLASSSAAAAAAAASSSSTTSTSLLAATSSTMKRAASSMLSLVWSTTSSSTASTTTLTNVDDASEFAFATVVRAHAHALHTAALATHAPSMAGGDTAEGACIVPRAALANLMAAPPTPTSVSTSSSSSTTTLTTPSTTAATALRVPLCGDAELSLLLAVLAVDGRAAGVPHTTGEREHDAPQAAHAVAAVKLASPTTASVSPLAVTDADVNLGNLKCAAWRLQTDIDRLHREIDDKAAAIKALLRPAPTKTTTSTSSSSTTTVAAKQTVAEHCKRQALHSLRAKKRLEKACEHRCGSLANVEQLLFSVGGTSALVTFMCAFCTLRTQSYAINLHLYTLQLDQLAVNRGVFDSMKAGGETLKRLQSEWGLDAASVSETLAGVADAVNDANDVDEALSTAFSAASLSSTAADELEAEVDAMWAEMHGDDVSEDVGDARVAAVATALADAPVAAKPIMSTTAAVVPMSTVPVPLPHSTSPDAAPNSTTSSKSDEVVAVTPM
jgi:hypothetical protein